MYGTIYRFEPKPGKEAEALRFLAFETQQDIARLKAAGMVAASVYKLDKGAYMGVVAFENKEKYVANANDPAQDQWYQQFRELLASDPEWNDGEIVGSIS